MNKLLFLTISLFISSTITCMEDIHQAATEGNLERVQEFLNTTPSLVDSRNISQWTPLHCVALKGHMEIALLLLNNGANVGADNQHQHTPLHYAVHNGHGNVTLLLLNYSAPVDAYNHFQQTPLHLAALRGHLEIVLLLLNHGASVDAQDKNQRTALNCAEEYDNREVAQLLRDWSYLRSRQQESLVAFCMAQHPRLGHNSPVNVLTKYCYQNIAQHVFAEWANHTINQIHDMAEQEREIEIERRQQ